MEIIAQFIFNISVYSCVNNVMFESVIFIEQIDETIVNLIHFCMKMNKFIAKIKWMEPVRQMTKYHMNEHCSMFNFQHRSKQESRILFVAVVDIKFMRIRFVYSAPTHFNRIRIWTLLICHATTIWRLNVFHCLHDWTNKFQKSTSLKWFVLFSCDAIKVTTKSCQRQITIQTPYISNQKTCVMRVKQHRVLAIKHGCSAERRIQKNFHIFFY